jgi:hypothetical protein
MIHQHPVRRHHYPYTHYIPYVILAIAAVALVFLLVNMLIPEISRIQLSPASSPVISPEQRVQQYWQFEASRWQAIADGSAKKTIPLTASEKYAYNLSSEQIPGRVEGVSSYYTGELDFRSLGVAGGGFLLNRDSLLPTSQQSMSAAERYGYNLTGESIPGRLKTSSGFRGDAIPYQAKPWLQPEVKQGFRGDAIPYQAKPWLQPGLITVDQHTYNLIAQYIPDFLPKVQQSISSGKLPAAQPGLITVDQHTYNLIAQYIPDLLSKVQLTDAEN